MTELKHLLDRAADGTDTPLRTDPVALLHRARSARRRHRAGIAVGALSAVTALAVATPLAATQLRGGPSTEPGALTPAASASADATLSESEVVARCYEQVQSYNALARWGAGAGLPPRSKLPIETYRAPNSRRYDYRVGDVASVESAEMDSFGSFYRLCLIPATGHESDPVPLTTFVPAVDDDAMIAQVCSETEPQVGQVRNLRGAEVVAAQRGPLLLAALLRQGDDYYACSVPHPDNTDDMDHTINLATPQSHVVVQAGVENGKPTGPVDAYYYAAGRLDEVAGAPVAAIRIEIRDQPTFTVPVQGGEFAFVHVVPDSPGGIHGTRYTLLDADGDTLGEPSTWSDAQG